MLTNPSYNDHGPYTVQHNARPHYASVNTNDAEVLRKRAISPKVAAARGTRTAGNRMIIPLWNTQGETGPKQYRPHNPTPGDDGKMRKYLFKKGTGMILDVHPWSYPFLRILDVPIIITESALKADAIISALVAAGVSRFCVVSIAGVSAWRSNELPLSDFDDIKKHLRGRVVYIAFDSNALTNANVARARWGLSQFLKRKKARVLYIDVPEGEGETVKERERGIDDVLASGISTMPAMLASAYPAPDFPPAVDVAPADVDDLPEVDRLRQENAYLKQKNTYLERENAYLVRLSKSSYLAGTDRAMLVNIGTQTLAKVSRGELEPDGRVRLTPAEISEDYRPKPEAGEARMKTNPNGEPFLMTRGSVKGRAEAAKAAGLLSFELKATRKERKNGRPYVDHDLLITPPVSLAEFLRPAAMYVPEELQTRADYRKQEPCPHCNEVHERTVRTTRRTYCGTVDDPGCGAQIGEKETTVTIPVPSANRPEITDEQRERLEITDEQRERLERQTATEPDRNQAQAGTVAKNVPIDSVSNALSSPPSSNYVGAINVAVESTAAEPDRMLESMPADMWKQSAADASTCHQCKTPLPPGNRTGECRDCTAHYERLNDVRWRYPA